MKVYTLCVYAWIPDAKDSLEWSCYACCTNRLMACIWSNGGGEQEWTAQVGQPNAAFMGPLETQGQENHSQFTQGLCTMEVTSTPKSPIQTKISVLCCIFSWISWAQEVWHHCVLANRICSLFYESWPLRALGELYEYWKRSRRMRQKWYDRLALGGLCHMVCTLPLESGHILDKPDSESEAYWICRAMC